MGSWFLTLLYGFNSTDSPTIGNAYRQNQCLLAVSLGPGAGLGTGPVSHRSLTSEQC